MSQHSSRGWWNTKQFEEPSDDEFRIPISKANLTPWHWGGIRGEMMTAACVSAFVLIVYLGAWKAGIVVPLLILCLGKSLHTWHPYWIEILVRMLVQPEGFQDS